MFEDDLPQKKKSLVEKQNLEIMGIHEIEDYIADLKLEIARAELFIQNKHGHRAEAEKLFGGS